jgi:dTDP-4-amino-4,6-dideoxygalactose transaminase
MGRRFRSVETKSRERYGNLSSELGVRSVPFVDLRAQFHSIRTEVETAINGVIERCDFILGDSVAEFEAEMAAYCEAAYGIGVDSGTSALELALMALDIGPGDEVITAANTFIATALAISYVGATPVLVDIDPDTYQIDPGLIEGAITPRTKAIMPVHLYGHPADMDPILDIAARHGLKVIEDASQAHGARYKGRRVGALGDIGAFSLYPAKNLGAYGDAGVLVTSDPALDEKLRLLRNYGSVQKYHHEIRGFNRRLDTMQAAVLRVKLAHLDGWNAARRSHADAYNKALEGLADSVRLPKTADYAEPVFHLYVVRHEDRDGLQDHLGMRGIGTVIHYPIPIHLQPAYADLGQSQGSFPVTEAFADGILSLPMYAELERSHIEYVCAAINEFADHRKPSITK